MLQQTPLAVTVAPPLFVTFPPLVAVLLVMAVRAVVETVGAVADDVVVKVSSFPYDVPTLLVAQALT